MNAKSSFKSSYTEMYMVPRPLYERIIDSIEDKYEVESMNEMNEASKSSLVRDDDDNGGPGARSSRSKVNAHFYQPPPPPPPSSSPLGPPTAPPSSTSTPSSSISGDRSRISSTNTHPLQPENGGNGAADLNLSLPAASSSPASTSPSTSRRASVLDISTRGKQEVTDAASTIEQPQPQPQPTTTPQQPPSVRPASTTTTSDIGIQAQQFPETSSVQTQYSVPSTSVGVQHAPAMKSRYSQTYAVAPLTKGVKRKLETTTTASASSSGEVQDQAGPPNKYRIVPQTVDAAEEIVDHPRLASIAPVTKKRRRGRPPKKPPTMSQQQQRPFEIVSSPQEITTPVTKSQEQSAPPPTTTTTTLELNKCNLCGSIFARPFSLKRHLINIHKFSGDGKPPALGNTTGRRGTKRKRPQHTRAGGGGGGGGGGNKSKTNNRKSRKQRVHFDSPDEDDEDKNKKRRTATTSQNKKKRRVKQRNSFDLW